MRSMSARLARALMSATSALALGAGSAHAQVITNPPTPFTNSGTINGILFNDGAPHAGDVTNATSGTINFLAPTAAIAIRSGSILNGNVVNNGAINGGVSGFGTVQFLDLTNGTLNGAAINTGTINLTAGTTANDTAILFSANGSNLTGGFRNNGTITEAGRTAMGPTYLFSMLGGVVNNGTMTFTGIGPSSNVGGITLVANVGNFSGGVTNNGTINVTGDQGPITLTPILGGPAAITT